MKLLAACLLFAAVYLQAQPPAGDLCGISGRVVNAANGDPVRRARLTLRRSDNPAGGSGSPAAYTTVTDEHGRFAMKDIDPGKYDFSARHAGFADTAYGARRPGGVGITLSLDAGQQLTRVLFRLTPQAVISGRILDQEGDPIRGVQVRAVRYRYSRGARQLVPARSAQTDDLGEYRVFGLSPGRYYLEATYRDFAMQMQAPRRSSKAAEEGYLPTFYPGATDTGSASAVELAPGTQLRGMEFALLKGRTVHVSGRVEYPAGANPLRTMVTLVPRGQSFAWDSMRRPRVIDEKGTFEVTDVRPGAYILSASLPDGKTSYSARQILEVNGSHMENVILTLSAGGEVPGQLRFEGQTPPDRTEIEVSLHERERGILFGPNPSGEIKEDGSFILSNVGTAIWEASVRGLPEGYYLKSVRIGDDELKETGIDTTHGAAGPLLLTVSSGAGQIEGVVLNTKQQSVPAATVVLVPEPGKRARFDTFKQVTTDQHGRFVLKTIEPGEYKLFAWEDLEPGDYMDPAVLKPVEEQGHPVSIREGSRETAELKLIPVKPPVK